MAPERLCTRDGDGDGLLLQSLDLNSILATVTAHWRSHEPFFTPPSSRKGGSGCELVRAPRRTTLLLPSFKLIHLTSVASRRSFSQGQFSSVQFIGDIGRRRRSSFWWGHAVPCIVQSAPCGQRTAERTADSGT